MLDKIRIITRESALAMWQAEFVRTQLNSLYPRLLVEIIGVTTQGDKILDVALDKIGGKALFINELELGLLNYTADIAVHSLKDFSADVLPEFKLAAILKRGDARDVMLSTKYTDLAEMPDGGIIGTSSARRVAFLNKYYPHLTTKLLRGNLHGRIRKLDNAEYDGIILAQIGVSRLGLDHRISQYLSLDTFVPAIGQGALAIEILQSRSDLHDMLQPLADMKTTICTSCEREVGRLLGASCSVPLAVHATLANDNIILNAVFADIRSKHHYTAQVSGNKHAYLELAHQCVDILQQQGACSAL